MSEVRDAAIAVDALWDECFDPKSCGNAEHDHIDVSWEEGEAEDLNIDDSKMVLALRNLREALAARDAAPEHNHDIVDGSTFPHCGACGTLAEPPRATPPCPVHGNDCADWKHGVATPAEPGLLREALERGLATPEGQLIQLGLFSGQGWGIALTDARLLAFLFAALSESGKGETE